MEHPIFIPQDSKIDLANRINQSISRIDFSNFGNEPNYTPALVQQLSNFQYDDGTLSVSFEGAVMTSVGPRSAEKISGADFSVVASISKNGDSVRKAILIQSKIGTIEEMRIKNSKEYLRCEEQIRDMKALTRHPKVLEISKHPGQVPTVVSGTSVLIGKDLQHLPFGDWIAKRVLPTFDGDKSPDFVEGVLDAKLTSLRVKARIR